MADNYATNIGPKIGLLITPKKIHLIDKTKTKSLAKKGIPIRGKLSEVARQHNRKKYSYVGEIYDRQVEKDAGFQEYADLDPGETYYYDDEDYEYTTPKERTLIENMRMWPGLGKYLGITDKY